MKTLKAAFLDTQTPVERFSSAIDHLTKLAEKFPSRATEINRSIAAMRAEMEAASPAAQEFAQRVAFIDRVRANSARMEHEAGLASLRAARGRDSASRASRFARGAAWEAGFNADLDAGLARQRASGGGGSGGLGGSGAAGGGGFMRLNQATGIAGKALTALNSGSILPLIGSLGSTGLAGAAVAAGVGLAALSHKAIQVADAAKQAKEEFFAKVDALKRLGSDTGFADHVTRVKSLKTAWGEARSAAEQYVTTLIGRLEGGGALGGAALGASNMSATGDIAASGLRRLNAVTETHAQRMERMRFLIANGRLAGEEDRAGRVPGLREDFQRKQDEHRKTRMKEFAELMENMAKAEKMAHDEKIRGLKEHAEKVGALADKMRSLFDETRTPAEQFRAKLQEIMSMSALDAVDPSIRQRALRDLEDKALGMIGGRPERQSQQAIRAGSVEALRAQFPGGTKDEKALREAEKTAKNTAEAKTVLVEIRDAIKSTSMGVAE